jgi:signal transduction histidine kinase
MEEDAHRLMRAGLLTSAASHEVKNLICAIRAQAQVGLLTGRRDAARESLKAILTATHEMGSWFSSLLSFATGNGTAPGAVDVTGALDGTLDLLAPMLRQGRITIAREFRPVPLLSGESSRYRQVFFNLLLNARDAMLGKGGILTARVRPVDDDVLVEVRDTGPGLPADMLDRIFEPFASDRHAGSGLGLYVAKTIVTDLGGTIEADSNPRGGAVFRVRFPA